MAILRRLPFAFAIVLALAFWYQGSRGLWEPDEGFYANGSLSMLDEGDPWLPKLNGEPFLDKPPLVYWISSAGVLLAGRNEWGLRLGHAIAFALTALLAGLAAGRLVGEHARAPGMLIYATTTLPFVASNVLTPDTPLALGLGLACYGFLRLETDEVEGGTFASWMLTSSGFGLALLAKGPAALPFAAAALAHRLLSRRWVDTLFNPLAWIGTGIAASVGLAWYVWLFLIVPAASEYVVHSQVVGRLANDAFARNPGLVGFLRVYLPTLVLGFLPWSPWGIGELFFHRRFGRPSAATRPERPQAFLRIWFALPLLVFCLAQSRLPFYLLPFAFPVALAATTALFRTEPSEARRRRFVGVFLAAATLLVVIKTTAAHLPSYSDSRSFAAELRALAAEAEPTAIHNVVSVDVNRNALPLYVPWPIEWVTTDATPYPFFVLPETFETELTELQSCPRLHLVLTSTRAAADAARRLEETGQSCERRDPPRHHPMFLCRRADLAASEPFPAGG